uniref:Uncharacterized protein n=1 Tax=Globisporangium ultimum (strain ATCC 200006 / CBS 805.95 / DAOM BR144) TaxID=431595 RepID=K3WVK3_GLOUD
MADNADDDALNDFSDFPELDFDEEMPSMKVQFNKENNSYNTKKRSIEDLPKALQSINYMVKVKE